MLKKISSLAHKEQGATAIEYGLIAGLIAAALVGTIVLVQSGLIAQFGAIVAAL